MSNRFFFIFSLFVLVNTWFCITNNFCNCLQIISPSWKSTFRKNIFLVCSSEKLSECFLFLFSVLKQSSFFFEDASMSVYLVEECFLLMYFFVIFDPSVPLPLHFSKTGFLRKSLNFVINLPANTGPFKEDLQSLLI